MAVAAGGAPCTVVLHDDAISHEDVLCGVDVLPPGSLAFLHAPGAKIICVHGQTPASNVNEISLHVSLAGRYGFENRTKATIETIDDVSTATATHVELLIRDQHLSRADMWRMQAQVDVSVLYQNQQLKYLGSVAATVESIYISGRRVESAFASNPQTKLIFRSAKARFTILVQISKEMTEDWNGGDLMYETVLTGLLPELFRRWDRLKVRHLVSVVLFGRRLKPSRQQKEDVVASDVENDDFFHILSSDTQSGEWRDLLRRVKRALNDITFRRQVSLAARGNLLEAIHMAAIDFTNSTQDPHLASTGGSIVLITAGAGLFQVTHELLRHTTELLMGTSIGVDLVSLSPKPLHPVPLFQYDYEGSLEYALPHWLDISFWKSHKQSFDRQWLMADTTGQIKDIQIAKLTLSSGDDVGSSTVQNMNAFDEQTFQHSLAAGEAVRRSWAPAITSSRTNGTLVEGKATLATPHDANTKPMSTLETREDVQTNIPRLSNTLSLKAGKRERTLPHPLMQSDRKISLGPRGLAPSLGLASTTVSAQHAQQAKEISQGSVFPTAEATSGVTKQIRESLKKKPSQQSLSTRGLQDSATTSNPINIHSTGDNTTAQARDPASLVEEAIMKQAGSSEPDESESISSTPTIETRMHAVPKARIADLGNRSMTPWLTLLNPCNPRQDNMRVASEYRQWQNAFPRAIGHEVFKWESLCTPAALPLLTESRVATADLEQHFEKRIRRILTNNASTSKGSSTSEILVQVLSMRLAAGFQVVPIRKPAYEKIVSDSIDRILLSLGDCYHDLTRLSDSEVQLTEYERRDESTTVSTKSAHSIADYSAKMSPLISRKERPIDVNMARHQSDFNWSRLDDQAVNPTASRQELGLYRMRFVLIPVEPPRTSARGMDGTRELSDEERRLDGIQKLTQMWQRHRYSSSEDQRHQASRVKSKTSATVERDPNPLAIEYQTRDTSAVVGAYGLNLTAQVEGDMPTSLFTDSERFHSTDFDTAKLIKQMQELPPRGIDLRDRRWFTRLHLKCFRGDEMTNWLLRVFKDLVTREDAVALGNQLMDRDIFDHVRGKHEFRDGHYFYQIRAAHRTTQYPDTAGFFDKAIGRSVPSTPITETKSSPSVRPIKNESQSSGTPTPTPTLAPVDRKERKEVVLSQKLQYNVDTSKRSHQLEIVNLHYDRIHNPENCYHIQLDWTNTTPKLIRESVLRWSAIIEVHGLKLVQLPIAEACRVHEEHPFDQVVPVKLALRPPNRKPATPQLDPSSFSPRLTEDSDGYHKAILRGMDFVLDTESSRSFPRNVDVTFSWGHPDYQHTQFVHKSGLLLAQISQVDKSDFLLLPNRFAIPAVLASGPAKEKITPEIVAEKFMSFCKDEKALQAFFEESNKPRLSAPSPFAHGMTADNNDIPAIELPPQLGHRALLKNIR